MSTKSTQAGIIRITNTDTGRTTYSAIYDIEDIVCALGCGEEIADIVARLDTQRIKHEWCPPSKQQNSFPLGM